MVRSARVVRGGVAGAALVLLGGCGGPPPQPVSWEGRPPDSVADVLASVRARSESLSTLRGGLEIVWDDPGTGRPEGCSASLTYERPGRLRLSARTSGFFTVFDLVMGLQRVWLDIPREHVTVAGARSDPAWDRLPVAPVPLLVALLADPWAGGEVSPDARREQRGEDVFLVGPDWTLRVDPRSGLPAEYRRGEVSIRWGEWALRKGIPWAYEIEMQTPAGRLEARLGRLLIDRNLPERTFDFVPEPDRELLTPDEAKVRWESGTTPG